MASCNEFLAHLMYPERFGMIILADCKYLHDLYVFFL
jgi:hypothetical protein